MRRYAESILFMKRFVCFFALLLLLSATKMPAPITIFMIGDSTMADKNISGANPDNDQMETVLAGNDGWNPIKNGNDLIEIVR